MGLSPPCLAWRHTGAAGWAVLVRADWELWWVFLPTSAEQHLCIQAKAARTELIRLLSLDILSTAWKQPLQGEALVPLGSLGAL